MFHRRILAVLWGSLILGAPNVASAHEQAIGLSEINLILAEDGDCSGNACRIEVAHRLSIHDAESTLMSVLGARADLVNDSAAQAKFETYVADRFRIVIENADTPVPLALLGGEVERGYYWVYQEASIEAPPAELNVVNAILMDAIPAQTNQVNLKLGSEVKTEIFRQDPGPTTFTFDEVTAR